MSIVNDETCGTRFFAATDLEAAIDRYNADLPNLDSFIIPGGSGLAAGLHLARTVVALSLVGCAHRVEFTPGLPLGELPLAPLTR